MVDYFQQQMTITETRREDRAMLRSNPSARPGAEAWMGVSLNRRLPPAFYRPCFGANAINLNGFVPTKTLLHWGAVGHMSSNAGRTTAWRQSKSPLAVQTLWIW